MKDQDPFGQTMRQLLTVLLLTTALAAQAQSWTNRFHGSPDGDDWATAIAVDGTGNVIVTGAIGGGRNGLCYRCCCGHPLTATSISHARWPWTVLEMLSCPEYPNRNT